MKDKWRGMRRVEGVCRWRGAGAVVDERNAVDMSDLNIEPRQPIVDTAAAVCAIFGGNGRVFHKGF